MKLPRISVDLLYQGDEGYQRCVPIGWGSRNWDIQEQRNAIDAQFKEDGNLDKALAALVSLVSQSYVGEVEEHMGRLIKDNYDGPDKDKLMWTYYEKALRKHPQFCDFVGRGYLVGDNGFPKNVPRSREIFLRGALFGSSKCNARVQSAYGRQANKHGYFSTDPQPFEYDLTLDEMAVVSLLGLANHGESYAFGYLLGEYEEQLEETGQISEIGREVLAINEMAIGLYGKSNNPSRTYVVREMYRPGFIDERYLQALALKEAGFLQDAAVRAYQTGGVATKAAQRQGVKWLESLPETPIRSEFRRNMVISAARAGAPEHMNEALWLLFSDEPRAFWSDKDRKWYSENKNSDMNFVAGLLYPAVTLANMPQDTALNYQIRYWEERALKCAPTDQTIQKSTTSPYAFRERCKAYIDGLRRFAPGSAALSYLVGRIDALDARQANERAARFAKIEANYEAQMARQRAQSGYRSRFDFSSSAGSGYRASGSSTTPPSTLSSTDAYKAARERGVRTCIYTGGSNCQR